MLRKVLESGVATQQEILSVFPLTCALQAGAVLSFPLAGGASFDLSVATSASIGDTEITILPYGGKAKLAYRSVAPGPPEDLSGQSWRAQIRTIAASPKILATVPITTWPLEGLVVIEIPAAATQGLATNAEYAEYKADAYASTPYAIDVEAELSDGRVYKRAYGDAYVVREVTR
jgi:hypothetical protein